MMAVGWILSALSLAFAVPLLLGVVVLVLQLGVGSLAKRTGRIGDVASATPPGPRGKVAIVVPAHDEESGIAEALGTVLPQLRAGDRLLVVADNCSDATAAVAHAAGAEVIERQSDLRGKGYALGFGIDHLRAAPPDMVVIVDADCHVAEGALDALLQSLATHRRPVQALYLMLATPEAGVGRRLGQFAWRVRNWVRPAGWARLGFPCQLMGTGMAFSWDMLRDARLANASIVEDMKLGIDLARDGAAPVFCERALVTSRFPDAATASTSQRTRWEHGHIEMILREVPLMLRTAVARRDASLLAMAFDLMVPPLALLAGLLVLDWLLALAARLVGGPGAVLGLASAMLILFCCAIMLAWARRGTDLVRLTELLSVPWYILAKVPIYLRFIVRRQKDWIRTDRR